MSLGDWQIGRSTHLRITIVKRETEDVDPMHIMSCRLCCKHDERQGQEGSSQTGPPAAKELSRPAAPS